MSCLCNADMCRAGEGDMPDGACHSLGSVYTASSLFFSRIWVESGESLGQKEIGTRQGVTQFLLVHTTIMHSPARSRPRL